MAESVLVVNTTGERIEEYWERTAIRLPADGVPHLWPRELALRYVKTRSVEIIEDADAYFREHPDAEWKALVIRDGGLGDLLLLEPCLREFKKRYPQSKLTLACHPNNVALVKCFESVDEVITCDEARPADYSWSVDLRAYSETAKSRTDKHRTYVYLERFPFDELADPCPRMKFEPWNAGLSTSKPVYVVQSASSHVYRDWPHTPVLVRELAKRGTVLVVGAPADDAYDGIDGVHNLTGATTTEELINYVAQADAVIAPDSGIMHIAMALGIPTVGLFGIIRPALRTKYYKGQHTDMIRQDACTSPHCGELHMSKCQVSSIGAACMAAITTADVLAELDKLPATVGARVSTERRTAEPTHTGAGLLTLVAICQNEAAHVERWIKDVAGAVQIGRVVVVDGGSTDGCDELLRKAGAEVYFHPYDPLYHDMQAMQRNISFSYCHEGERCLVMDFDEAYSETLRMRLADLAMTKNRRIDLSRRTYLSIQDAALGRQIKDYPDWQPRFFQWSHRWKWWRSPHHVILSAPEAVKESWDILHYEGERKDRAALESKWAEMERRTKKYYG